MTVTSEVQTYTQSCLKRKREGNRSSNERGTGHTSENENENENENEEKEKEKEAKTDDDYLEVELVDEEVVGGDQAKQSSRTKTRNRARAQRRRFAKQRAKKMKLDKEKPAEKNEVDPDETETDNEYTYLINRRNALSEFGVVREVEVKLGPEVYLETMTLPPRSELDRLQSSLSPEEMESFLASNHPPVKDELFTYSNPSGTRLLHHSLDKVMEFVAANPLLMHWEQNRGPYGQMSLRLQSTFGSDYKFGGNPHQGHPLNTIPGLEVVMKILGCIYNCRFGMAHFNMYNNVGLVRGGKPASLMWHKDNQPVIEPGSPIVSFSWGNNAPMRFDVGLDSHVEGTEKVGYPKKYETLVIGNQEFVAMIGSKFQAKAQHRVRPCLVGQLKGYKSKSVNDERQSSLLLGTRFNVTFRVLAK